MPQHCALALRLPLPAALDALGALKVLVCPLSCTAMGYSPGIGHALQEMGRLMERLWPSGAERRQTERRLATREWVPAVPAAPPAAGGGSQQQPQQADSPLAAKLRAALQEHCPEISLADMRRSVLVLRQQMAWDHSAGSTEEQRALLAEAQLLLDGGDDATCNVLYLAMKGGGGPPSGADPPGLWDRGAGDVPGRAPALAAPPRHPHTLPSAGSVSPMGQSTPNSHRRRTLMREYLEAAYHRAMEAKCELQQGRPPSQQSAAVWALGAAGAAPCGLPPSPLTPPRRRSLLQGG